MKIFKPEWINHTQKKAVPIYSIHVNPRNQKIATGGQDFKIKIWNMEPVKQDCEAEKLLSVCVLHDGFYI
jgi:protein HIRA/HIR1